MSNKTVIVLIFTVIFGLFVGLWKYNEIPNQAKCEDNIENCKTDEKVSNQEIGEILPSFSASPKKNSDIKKLFYLEPASTNYPPRFRSEVSKIINQFGPESIFSNKAIINIVQSIRTQMDFFGISQYDFNIGVLFAKKDNSDIILKSETLLEALEKSNLEADEKNAQFVGGEINFSIRIKEDSVIKIYSNYNANYIELKQDSDVNVKTKRLNTLKTSIKSTIPTGAHYFASFRQYDITPNGRFIKKYESLYLESIANSRSVKETGYFHVYGNYEHNNEKFQFVWKGKELILDPKTKKYQVSNSEVHLIDKSKVDLVDPREINTEINTSIRKEINTILNVSPVETGK